MHPKAVPLTIGETPYTLFYNLASLMRLRDLGVDAFALDVKQLTDPRVIHSLLFAGLQEYHPDITKEQVGKLDLCDLGDASLAITSALQKATQKEIVGPDPQ